MSNTRPPKIDLPGKPTYLKLAEDYNFFELFRKIENKYDTCFFLESLGAESNISRYHIIGFDPVQIISANDNNTLVIEECNRTTKYTCENAYYELRKIVPQSIISRKYAGGLVGFMSYDCISYFERTLDIKKHKDFEKFKFGVYLDGLVYDVVTGEIFYYFYRENRFDKVKEIANGELPKLEKTKVKSLGNSMTKSEHAKSVAKIKRNICDGLIFQCEVGFKTKYSIDGSTLPIYEKLRQLNPSPHMYYAKFKEQKIIGASPELLFRLRNGEMETFPLAGTIQRGANADEDRKLSRTLLNDKKEIAEHNMLVDLHRNDIGKVARFGTVKVRSLMDIKRYSHVQHISSEIVGILSEKEDMFSALASNFPAGTLTGAPKIEAIKIINKQEPEARGVYGGALGQFCFNGDCTFAIPIRSLFINGKLGYAQTSGGIVYDSNNEDEYLEIQNKLSAMKIVLKSFEDN